MSDRSFGRTIRARRTKLGLSQAKLGELVGRSSTTVRSWERDQSQPTDARVITALSAILGVDEEVMFEKAGQTMPMMESSPTMEEALATLDPKFADEAASGEAVDDGGRRGETVEDHDREDEVPGRDAVPASPAFVAPPPAYRVTTAIPPAHEPSYMEDRTQRQLYRVRNLATVVVLVSLGIALLWAAAQSWDAFSTWWDEFFGSLRL